MMQNRNQSKPRQAFTLIELLVSMAVLSLLMVMVFEMVDSTQKTWNVARSRVSQFREARAGFEAVTRSLSQVTLNTYWDYDYGNGESSPGTATNPRVPVGYQRQSELHFICGPSDKIMTAPGGKNRPGHAIFFQVPGGFGTDPESEQLNDLVNARGFFVQYGEDSEYKPSFLREETPPRWRFRLMEFRPPSENTVIYLDDLVGQGINVGEEKLREWFNDQVQQEFQGGSFTRPVADNIIAAFFLPKFPEEGGPEGMSDILTKDYYYDSREWQSGTNTERATYSKNQLPPLIEVTMVAVDEKSMIRYQQFDQGGKSEMPPFVPSSAFTNFSSYKDFREDVEKLKNSLDDAKISHRLFNQTVLIRGSGFSDTF